MLPGDEIVQVGACSVAQASDWARCLSEADMQTKRGYCADDDAHFAGEI